MWGANEVMTGGGSFGMIDTPQMSRLPERKSA